MAFSRCQKVCIGLVDCGSSGVMLGGRCVEANLKRTSAATQIFTQTRHYENIPHVRS